MPSLICIISPAKSLAAHSNMLLPVTRSVPIFLQKTHKLVELLRDMRASEFKKLMSISDTIAQRTYEEYQNFQISESITSLGTSSFMQAGLLFDGPAYRGLCCAALSPEEMNTCQQSVRFLSGLYGLLRAGDLIQNHRLEMGTTFKGLSLPSNAKTLYEYWASTIAENITTTLKPNNTGAYVGMLLNCASEEYFKVIDTAAIAASGCQIVTCVFTDKGKVVSVYAKRARGLMARFVSTNAKLLAAMRAAEAAGGNREGKLLLLSALQEFSLEGYVFKHMSEDKNGMITLYYDRAGAAPVQPVHEISRGSAAAVAGQELVAEQQNADSKSELGMRGLQQASDASQSKAKRSRKT